MIRTLIRNLSIALSLLLPAAAQTPSNSNQAISVRNFGARGDEVTNDTAAIQAAIDSVPVSGTIDFPAGTYTIAPIAAKTRFILLKPNIKLKFERGAILKVAAGSAPYDTVLTAPDCANCEIEGGVIDSNVAANPVANHAEIMAHGRIEVAIWAGSNIYLHGLTIRNSTAVNSLDVNGPAVSSVRIQDCAFLNMGEDPNHVAHDESAIYVNGNGAIITGNVFVAAHREAPGAVTAIETHSTGMVVSNNTITGFLIGANITGMYFADSEASLISNNSVTGALFGLNLWSYAYHTHTTGYGINGMMVTGNSIRINQTSYTREGNAATCGICLEPNGTLPVANIRITDNVLVFDLENTVRKGNTASIGIGWYSTQTQAMENLSIENNTIDNPPVAGIRLVGVLKGVRIAGNIIRNAGSSLDPSAVANYRYPVFISASPATGLEISDNIITDTLAASRMKYGMYLATVGSAPSSGVVLQDNRISLAGANQASFLGQVSIDANTRPLLREVWSGFTPASYPVAALSQVIDPRNAKVWHTNADGANWIADSAGAQPVCQKHTIAGSSLKTAAATQDVTLFRLPAGAVITGIRIKHSQAFAGGALTALTVSVGTPADPVFHSKPFNLFQPVAGTAMLLTGQFATNDDNAHNILARFISTGGNLNTITQGTVDITACWVNP